LLDHGQARTASFARIRQLSVAGSAAAFVTQTYKETRLERSLKKAGVGFCEGAGITGSLELFKVNVGQREFFKVIE